MDYAIKIGGEAGQGIQTIGGTLARVFARAGHHVFTHQDYESRIRGGHNFYQVRLADRPVTASGDRIDIIVALDKESIRLHEGELNENGVLIYDSEMLRQKHEKPRFLDVPFLKLAVEHGGSKIMANTVAVGAVLGMLGMNPDILFDILRETFRKKGEDIITGNMNAAKAGRDFALRNCTSCSFHAGETGGRPRMLINGSDAIGLGAVASGVKFYSAYPMTPSTGIMNYIAGKQAEYGIIVEQAEDEIAAINMVLGASFAGVRAMTGTSGGGFALMVEGLSLAGMTETPVVIALAQRPGPATGFPTRTEQGDLQFALYSAHGEFPRVIFAPGSPEQAFYLTNRAFEISEKYQVPVLVLTDQYLADCEWTFDTFDLDKIQYAGRRLKGDTLAGMPAYKRHAFTETGVTPLAVPGDSRHLVVTDSDEHDEEGHIVEDAETRIKMTDKRLFKKMPLIRQEMGPPLFYGNEKPEIVLTGWGSTYGVIREVVDFLSQNPPTSPIFKGGLIHPSFPKRGEGRFSYDKIAMLHFTGIWPFPSTDKFDYLNVLNNAGAAICIENNATGQFARLMRAETGYTFKHRINKYDGRPFTPDALIGDIHAVITGL
jgi:2-oxoglutarate ferredoxin oxidoreductase subunit alpha